MKFSVLMSVYDKEHPDYLKTSIDSIFNQSLLPDEVVLMEDGPLNKELYSTIVNLQKQYPELKVYSIRENKGLGNALNEGLQHCSHNIIARMDTDDICKPNRFEKQISFLKDNPDIDICSSAIEEFIVNTDNVITQKNLPELHTDIVQYAKKRCPINHPTVVYKKDMVIKAGGYIGFPEDYYLWVRMIQNGCKFYNFQESLLWFRSSPEVFKRRGGWKYAKNELKFQWLFFKIGFLTFPQFIYNSFIRMSVRVVPNRIRILIYKQIIRKV